LKKTINLTPTTSASIVITIEKSPQQVFHTAILNQNERYLFLPNVYTATYLNGSATVVTKNFDATGIQINSSVTESFDYFEPRSQGAFFIRPNWLTLGYWISTNYQKRLAVDASINYTKMNRANWWEWDYSWSTRIRLTNTLFLIHEWTQSFQNNSEGFAVPFGSPTENVDFILFGNRNRMNITNALNLNYTMTNRMGITCRVRHYRSSIRYNSFYELNKDGRLEQRQFNGIDQNGESAYNVNYNAFTVDFVYRWIFLPGSELSLVWKNSIFLNDKKIDEKYVQNLQSTLGNGQLNSISLKAIYWLDYQSLKRKSRKTNS
jgi:hypothetical protein